jgi:hypothetical protein
MIKCGNSQYVHVSKSKYSCVHSKKSNFCHSVPPLAGSESQSSIITRDSKTSSE